MTSFAFALQINEVLSVEIFNNPEIQKKCSTTAPPHFFLLRMKEIFYEYVEYKVNDPNFA